MCKIRSKLFVSFCLIIPIAVLINCKTPQSELKGFWENEKKIMELKNIPALKSYSSYLFEIEKQLGNLSSLINSSINKIIDINNNKINNLKLRLSILDINNLLNKGYSLVYKGNKLIKDISSLSLDDEIIIKTGNGKIVARITDLKRE